MSFQNDMLPDVAYQGVNNDGIGPSDIIWGRFKKHFGTRQSRSFEHDFTSEATSFASAAGGGQGGILTYQDTGVTILGSATLDNGLEIAGNDADNDEGNIGSSGNIAIISDAAADKALMGFEISVSKASIGNNGLAFFAGLIETGKVAANALTDDHGVLPNADYVGFNSLQDDGDSLDVVYRKTDGAAQAVETNCHTMVADTFMKLGMIYDPQNSQDRKMQFFVDGVDIGSYVTASDIAAATFPDGEALGWAFFTKVGTAAEVKAHCRWVRFCQLRVS